MKKLIEFKKSDKFITVNFEDIDHIDEYNEYFTLLFLKDGTSKYVDGTYTEIAKRLNSIGIYICRIDDIGKDEIPAFDKFTVDV